MKASSVLLSPVEALTGGFVLQEQISTAAQPSQMSDALLSQLAIAASVGDVQWGVERRQRQGFTVGDLRLMIAYEDGRELTELPEVFWVPNAPDWLLGVVNLHGLITPVFDLTAYWGDDALTPDNSHQRRLLVLGHGADAAGILIDDLPQRLSWGAADDRAVSSDFAPERLRPFLKAVRVVAGEIWFDVDVPVLLDALEAALAG